MAEVKRFVEKNSNVIQIGINNLLIVNTLLIIFLALLNSINNIPPILFLTFFALTSILLLIKLLSSSTTDKSMKTVEIIFFLSVFYEIILFFFPNISIRLLSLPPFYLSSLKECVTILLVLTLLILIAYTKGIEKSKQKRKIIRYAIPILIIIIVTTFAIQYLLIGRYYFWTDEVYTLNAFKMILKKGKPLYDSGLFYGRASIYHYLNAYMSAILGLNEVGTRIINILSSVFTSLIIFFTLKKKSLLLSLSGALLMMISSLTIASVIETRFYSFFTLFFFSTAIAFYNAFLKEEILKNKIKIGKSTITYNWKWLIVFLITIFVTYNTHQFFFLFIIGLFLYSILSSLIKGLNLKNIIIFIGSLLLIFIGAYYQSGTFNIINAFFRDDLIYWAKFTPKDPSYYLNFLQDHFILLKIFIISTLTIGILKKKKLLIYLFSIITGGLLFLSFQNAQQERYIFFVTPLLISLILLNIYYLWRFLANRILGKILVTLITLFVLITPLVNLANKLEIVSYSIKPISSHKELNFQKVFDYLDNKKDEYVLIADFHSAYTLLAYSYHVDYILLNPILNKQTIDQAVVVEDILTENYFNIPILIQNSSEYYNLVDDKKTVIVVRDEHRLISPINMHRVDKSLSPIIFTNTNN